MSDEPVKADDYLEALNELRLIVLLECIGDSCDEENPERHFHQVRLTERQFKKVSDALIIKKHKDDDLKDGYEMVEMRFTGTFDAKQFDGYASTM
jgi:hypothetical protein